MNMGGVVGAFIAVVAVLVVVGVVLTVVLVVRNASAYKRQGFDPTTADADLAARLMRSQALAPHESLEDRLRELDRLAAAGQISPEEHQAARSRLLGTL